MKKSFFTGLIILLPVVLTLFIIKLIINLLTKPFLGLTEGFLKYYARLDGGFWLFNNEQTIHVASQTLTLIVFFLLVVLMGAAGRWFFVHTFFRFADYLLHRIPFINKIYKACQEVIHTLLSDEKKDFGQVVLVPYPHKDFLAIGFIMHDTNKSKTEYDPDLISVFVAGTPNPTMGFMLLFKKEDVIYTDMKAEQALKCVISCGVMIPEFSIVRS